jgi:predicted porin
MSRYRHRIAMLAAVPWMVASLLAGAAGAAQAQSSVTVFGLLDVGLVRESGAAAGAMTKLSSGVANGSRLGFKGSEALGGGWSALFMLESGIQLDTGTVGQGGVLFGRQSWVGLRGPIGTLTVGRQYTPHFDTLALADPFGSGQVGDAKNLMPGTGDASTRMTNTIKYASARLKGVSGELAYAPGETAGSQAAGRQFGGALAYASGALNLRLGYHYRNSDTPAGQRGGARNWLLAATYDFGPVKAHFGYGVDKGIDSSLLRNPGNPYRYPVTPSGSADSTDLLLGLSTSLGRHTVMASYVRKDDKSGPDQDARQLALGHRYALSRRTDSYLAVAHIRNRNGAGYTVGNASEGGTGNQAFSAGIRHQF